LVGLATGLVLLAGVLGGWFIQRAALGETNAALALHVQAVLGTFDTLRSEWVLLTDTLGGGRRVAQACAEPGTAATIHTLEAIRQQVGFDIFLVTDLAGRVTTRATPPYVTGDILAYDPVITALRGGAGAGFVIVDPDRAVLALIAAAPARTTDGRQAGALVAGVIVNDSPLLRRRLRSLTVAADPSPEGAVASVFLSGSEVLSTRAPVSLPALFVHRDAMGPSRDALHGGSIWYGTADTPAGRFRVAAASLAEFQGGVGATVSVGLPAARYLAIRRSMTAWYGGVGLAGALVAVLISLHLARRLSRPINQLAHAATEVAAGSFDVRLEEPRARDEVWALTVAFNRMSDALSQRDAKLSAARDELQAANGSLAALNESYLNMLGFVSHELKNVLGTMTWSVQALEGGQMGSLTAPQARLVRSLRVALDGALAMTRSFLDLSRIETGRLALDLSDCDFARDVVRVVLDELGDESAHRSMTLESDMPDALPLSADTNLLRIVVRNLVGNALRYGRTGGRVRVASGLDGDHVWCEVWNEGDGLRPEQVAQLFEKFRRFASGKPGTPRGSGLGLFIVREIVRRHGGTIAAESAVGSWMKFALRLPVSGPRPPS
jgi:signal transduction histidine kinase